MTNVEKLTELGILEEIQESLTRFGNDVDEEKCNARINELSNDEILEQWSRYEIGDACWWTDMKNIFDRLEEMDKESLSLTEKDCYVGMKVIPIRKSAGMMPLEDSTVWKRAKEAKQPFLYITGINPGHPHNCELVLSEESFEVLNGDYFQFCDVVPYKE